jgi:hypothetical protein
MHRDNFVGKPITNIIEKGNGGLTTKFVEAKDGQSFTHEVVDLYRDRKQININERLGILNGQAVIVKKVNAKDYVEGVMSAPAEA